jgi:hypothetical protein
MQDDLYPPGMAPAGGKRDAPVSRPKVPSRASRPDTVQPADLLPPGAVEPTPHIDDADTELAELLPDAALPPEADVPASSSLPTATVGQNQIALSRAPSAARVAKQQDRQAIKFLVLTMLGSLALVTLLGVGYFLINPQSRTTVRVEQVPVAAEREPKTRQKPSSPQPPRRPKAPPQQNVPPVLRSNEPLVEDPSPPESIATDNSEAPATPPNPTPPVTVTKAEVAQLVKALEAAKAALGEANFQAADTNIDKAGSLAKLPKHQEAVARLQEISRYAQKFHEGVKAAAKGMQAGETFKVGTSTQVTFVEAKADKIILRIAGTNKTYPLNDLPPGLALAIAEFKLPSSDPTSHVIEGAYLLVHKRADSETREKARSLWGQAQSTGINLNHLMPFLNDDYAKFSPDAGD